MRLLESIWRAIPAQSTSMVYRRIPMSPATMIAVLGAGLMVLSSCGFSVAQFDSSYKQYPSLRDPERRREPLLNEVKDKTVDFSAFAGMPEPYAAAIAKYVESVCSEINAVPIKRRRFYHKDRPATDPDQYPDFVAPIPDRDVVVPQHREVCVDHLVGAGQVEPDLEQLGRVRPLPLEEGEHL